MAVPALRTWRGAGLTLPKASGPPTALQSKTGFPPSSIMHAPQSLPSHEIWLQTQSLSEAQSKLKQALPAE